MANYLTHYCFGIPVNEVEAAWFVTSHLELAAGVRGDRPQAEMTALHGQYLRDCDLNLAGPVPDIYVSPDTGKIYFSDDGGEADIELLCDWISRFFQEHRGEDKVIFEYAETLDRPRDGEHGGAAVLINARGWSVVPTSHPVVTALLETLAP